MKTCLILFFSLMSFSIFANEKIDLKNIGVSNNSLTKATSCYSNLEKELNSLDDIYPGLLLAQRGCCSWHKGVCGCSMGRTVCCDGTYSPTCRCN